MRWFFTGVGLQLAWLPALVLLQEVHGTVARQEAVRIAARSTGLGIPLIFLARGSAGAGRRGAAVPGGAAAGLAAEDDSGLGGVHLGRGLRCRALQRPVDRHARWRSRRSCRSGCVSGYQATKTGDLANSMMLHMGFNILSVIDLLVKIT